MGGKKKQRKAAKASATKAGGARGANRAAPLPEPAPEPEPEPEPPPAIQRRGPSSVIADPSPPCPTPAQQQLRREWAIDRTMRQLGRRQRDPKPIVNELSDSLAAFTFLPPPPPPPRRAIPSSIGAPPVAPPAPRSQPSFRDTAVFRWFMSLDHAAKCATLTIQNRQWMRALLCIYRLHASGVLLLIAHFHRQTRFDLARLVSATFLSQRDTCSSRQGPAPAPGPA